MFSMPEGSVFKITAVVELLELENILLVNPHSVVFLDTLVIQEYWVLVRKQTTTKAKDIDETGEK